MDEWKLSNLTSQTLKTSNRNFCNVANCGFHVADLVKCCHLECLLTFLCPEAAEVVSGLSCWCDWRLRSQVSSIPCHYFPTPWHWPAVWQSSNVERQTNTAVDCNHKIWFLAICYTEGFNVLRIGGDETESPVCILFWDKNIYVCKCTKTLNCHPCLIISTLLSLVQHSYSDFVTKLLWLKKLLSYKTAFAY